MKKLLLTSLVLLSALVCQANVKGEYKAGPDTLRILGVGNSWTRDSMRWLSAIAASAGKPVIVGHAYLGGSSLIDQYNGIDDNEYTYNHSGNLQVVHSTYQYWKYEGSVNPVKTPVDADYGNGSKGTGVTLESVVKDEPWDIIVFQPSGSVGLPSRYSKTLVSTRSGYSLEKLKLRIFKMMKPSDAAKAELWVMVPFSYPAGNKDHRNHIRDEFTGLFDQNTQEGWDVAFDAHHYVLQELVPDLAESIGAKGVVNVGAAVKAARDDQKLNKSGFCLQRSESNTHLSEGMAMYVASLAYAYTLLGISPADVNFCPSGTEELAEYARNVVWNSLKK